MKAKRLRRSASLAALTAVAGSTIALLANSHAEACTEPMGGGAPMAAPSDGGTMPASAPGPLLESVDPRTELFDAAGSPVAGSAETTADGPYFAPSAPLATGTYTLRIPSYVSDAPPRESSFTVTEAVPLPTETGTLSVKSVEPRKAMVTQIPLSCDEYKQVDVVATVVQLELDVDTNLGPYMDVVGWNTTVDGERWVGVRTSNSNGAARLSSEGLSRAILSLFAVCDAETSDAPDKGLKEGYHDVEVTPVLVGSDVVIAPAKLRVELSCSGSPQASSPTGNGSSAAPVATDSEDSAESGCAAAPGARGSSFGFGGLAVGAALALARLRRRAATRA